MWKGKGDTNKWIFRKHPNMDNVYSDGKYAGT
jgi:hypothetical protein